MSKKKVVLLSVVIFTLLSVCFLYATFDGVFQEGEPIPVLKGIFQLHTKDIVFSQISSEPKKYITRVRNENVFEEFAKLQGWKFIERMGGILIYQDGSGNQIQVYFYAVSRFYRCFRVQDT